jgi:hypothetical protein
VRPPVSVIGTAVSDTVTLIPIAFSDGPDFTLLYFQP